MFRSHKSATCCYCGTRTLLTLGGQAQHELKCAACGAPLSRLKALREDHVEDAFTVRGKKRSHPVGPQKKKAKKGKRRKSTAHRLFDLAEEVFDIFD
ncbi:hypothetical protein [Celeribacter indicus]|nr:hypothetical protein [Celeribacter indicus]